MRIEQTVRWLNCRKMGRGALYLGASAGPSCRPLGPRLSPRAALRYVAAVAVAGGRAVPVTDAFWLRGGLANHTVTINQDITVRAVGRYSIDVSIDVAIL